MAEENDDEKTEQPTDKKREDSRNDGLVAMSREVLFMFSVGTLAIVFYFGGRAILERAAVIFRFSIENFNSFSSSVQSMLNLFGLVSTEFALIFVPLMAALFVMGILGGAIQVGFKISTKSLEPKFSKINPISGLGRIFGPKILAELLIITTKTVLVIYISWITIDDNMISILNFSATNSRDFFSSQFEIVWEFIYRLFIISVLIGAIDYAYRKWESEIKLKMSKQEIKDEMKQTEGDPLIRARIREAQRKISQARMLQDVPKADVIITNPEHFAVVLKYDKDTMISPTMTGKGADFLALRIMEIARQNDVPIVRNPPVARALYAQMEIGDQVPEDFFKIIAEILAFVYKQKRRTV